MLSNHLASRFARCCLVLAVSGMASFARADDAAATDAARASLQAVADQARKINEADYTMDSWMQMRAVLNDAQRAARQTDASAVDLTVKRDALQASIAKLQKREIVPDDLPKLGLTAFPFAANPAGQANNVELMWATIEPADRVVVQRAKAEAGPFETVYTGTGGSFRDYDLPEGAYFYRMIVTQKGVDTTSNVVRASTLALPQGLSTYTNQVATETRLQGGALKIGDTFYEFRFIREGKGLKQLLLRTSTDEVNWKDVGPVMDTSSHPDLADCKFEAESAFYDKVHDRIVFWCHWEKAQGYGSGKALVATAKPGEQFTVHRVFNPLGVEVRDMSLFLDDDGKAYLVAASNVPGQGANATMYIFRLNDTYDDVVEVTAKVLENGYREAPHIVKKDGYYYLFYSQAAGWYPSQGGYLSSRSLAGPWSAPRNIGCTSTFSSQSGGIHEFGNVEPHVPVMMGNRWVRGEGTSRNSALPLHMDNGFAFYDYAPMLLNDPARSLLVPLDMGKLLSQDRPATASVSGNAGHEVSKAFDGDYFTAFQSDDKRWPFDVTSDLGEPCNVRNVQIAWLIHKGSEAFYTYTIEGSLDGQNWTTLVDRTDEKSNVISKTYGFSSDVIPGDTKVRFVKLNVRRAHLHNNPNNWYPPTIYEMKVFGAPAK
ncbi:MAG: family 43 glycosylhydrolase [Tepidisphaeraceae bacterium]